MSGPFLLTSPEEVATVVPSAGERRTGFTVVVARSAADLEPHRTAWDDLARCALEPNVFYESWMLLPAIEMLGRDLDLQFVLVFTESAKGGERSLCGFFPMERRRRYRGIPVRTASLWRHRYCFLGVPLLRAACAGACLTAFFEWMAADPRGAAVVEWPWSPGDGPLHQLLIDQDLEKLRLSYVEEQYTRGMLRPSAGFDSYLERALTSRQRKDLRRKERRLAEQGRVETRTLGPTDDPSPWTDAFLQLEASGWKGRLGTAMLLRPADADWFRTTVAEAHRRGQLNMIGLFLDGRAIALKCNFLAPPGSFAFKIAFDEAYASASPGLLLEIENLRASHERPGLAWMDSCTDLKTSMFDRLWTDRRVIRTVLLSTGRPSGDLLVSLLPLLRWAKRTIASVRRRLADGIGSLRPPRSTAPKEAPCP